jgi:phage FluMu protein Com
MAKDRSFAAKVAKGAKDQLKSKQCPKCGEVMNMIKLVSSEPKKDASSWRFKEKFVAVCKCNEKEIYG